MAHCTRVNARVAAWAVVAGTLILGVPASAADRAGPTSHVLVDATAAWQWQVVTAPALAPQLGKLAVSGLDVAAGRATRTIAVLGDPAPRPAGWPHEVGAMPRPAIGEPPAGSRIAAAFGVVTFVLAADHQALEMLELRLRYEDGVAVWLNGVEVVRRALPEGDTTALAARPHGPEWETFHVPVAPGLVDGAFVRAGS